MLTLQHGHYRPDGVERTGVIEPYDIQRYSPVDVARHTIDPFINGVRPPGPAVAPTPSAEAIANAASAVADSWAQGKTATIHIGAFAVKVAENQPAQGGIVGQIVLAARGLRTGRSVLVQSPGTKSVIMKARPGSQVIATDKGVAVKATPGPSANIAPAASSATTNSNSVAVSVGPSYPSTYDDLTTAADSVPAPQPGPFGPSYAAPQLRRRKVASWPAAGRAAIEAGAVAYGSQNGVPDVVSSSASQVASLQKIGI
jgi:hypothetical protein